MQRAMAGTIAIRHRQKSTTAGDNEAPFGRVIGDTPTTNYPKPDFLNHREVFKHKGTVELFRAYLVYTLCSFDFLMKHQTRVSMLQLHDQLAIRTARKFHIHMYLNITN